MDLTFCGSLLRANSAPVARIWTPDRLECFVSGFYQFSYIQLVHEISPLISQCHVVKHIKSKERETRRLGEGAGLLSSNKNASSSLLNP